MSRMKNLAMALNDLTPPPLNEWHSTVTDERVIEGVEEDDNIGFCLACGSEHYGVEPDARGYRCEECGASMVFGAEELLLYL